jgi:polyphosphate kinase
MKDDYINKEISWLSFNHRVLQEAEDTDNPLPERIKFLGIYSNNLDEFFRVRFATLKRLSLLGKKSIKLINDDPRAVLDEIQQMVVQQHKHFESVFSVVKEELARRNIFFIKENELTREQQSFVYNYFVREVRPKIFPVMIDGRYRFPELKDTALYLAVEMTTQGKTKTRYSIIEIPSKTCSRFVHLPSDDQAQHIILLEDIIRFGMPYIFSMLEYDTFRAYDIKITRDAELDIEDDFQVSYLNKIHKSLEKRKWGRPVRLTYDTEMPDEMIAFFRRKLKLKELDSLLPGGRYHNSRDYMQFPAVLSDENTIPTRKVPHKDLEGVTNIIDVIKKRDMLLHFPYHSFDHLIDLLREASLDPKVTCIKITLYRLARFSSVVNALINARKNRKEVVVILELQARFDEKANINWANKLKKEGVKVVFGVPGLKVHSKMLSITRSRGEQNPLHLCAIGTGNMNEDTARLYTDSYLLTSDPRISSEVEKIFDFLESNYRISEFEHLIISPFYTRKSITSLIQQEIDNALKGKEAYIFLKLNNLSDRKIISKIYEAGRAGVDVRLIVRSMFSVIAGKKGFSENIRAISIVDHYLEHTRFFIFGNGGKEKVFLSSADLLPRNIDRRVELICPIYNKGLKQEIKDLFLIEWSDTVKARILDAELKNGYVGKAGDPPRRSQLEKLKYIENIHESIVEGTTQDGAESEEEHVS